MAGGGMFVVFEGIDGSGKTTISNRVAEALRQRGLSVEHARQGGAFASAVTQGIRDFCRDARNLALVPRAELLLYAAREAQLAEEVIGPARARAEVVIADRYLYTAEVLARAGRDLAEDEVQPILEAAARGLWPDLVFLVDVDPSVARGRRKVAKILAPDPRPASRKGLTGSGLQQRLREGYLGLARRDPSRWVVLENGESDLGEVVATAVAIIERAREGGVAAAATAASDLAAEVLVPRRSRADRDPASEPIRTTQQALAAFLGWVDARAAREPLLAAYVMAGLAGPGIDERRLSLASAAPRVIARGLRGLADRVSWQLRRRLVEAAPGEVALSLEDQAAAALEAWTLRELLADVVPAEVLLSLAGLDDETAWALRAALGPRAPEAALASLALLAGPRAAAERERWLAGRGGLEAAVAEYRGARAVARSVTAVESEAAWALRKAARPQAPVAALASLKGLTSEPAWRWREQAIRFAPKAVLATIDGMEDGRAWALRVATAPRCREALDSMIGLDHPAAWEIRESCLELWPAKVVRSLGVLVNGARGQELLRHALAAFPRNISLLKQAATIATGGSLNPAVLAA